MEPEVEMNLSFPSIWPVETKRKNNGNLKFDHWSFLKSGGAAASAFTYAPTLNSSDLRFIKGTGLWKPE